MVKCSTKYCRTDAAPARTKCYKCRSRAYKLRNPDVYHFNALRNNARRRGKVFTISLDYFRGFCDATRYMECKGKNGHDLSIDRVKSHLGYVPGNIRVLSLSDNTKKEFFKVPF